ncbi:MAG: GGDEF domain-containing protein [Cognatishimia sp.]
MLEAQKFTAQERGIEKDLTVPIGLLNELSAAETTADILNCYSAWSGEILQTDRCTVALNDGNGGLVMTAIKGNLAIPIGATLPIVGSLIGRCFLERRTIIANDILTRSELGLPQLAKAGLRSVVLVPIGVANKCFGVLATAFFKPPERQKELAALQNSLGQCIGTQLLVQEQMNNLKKIAETDSLTGLCNRRSFRNAQEIGWQSWVEDRIPISVISIDVDHFKRVNDTLGHDAGDVVLVTIADRIAAAAGACGDDLLVARLGGEEFCVLLRGDRCESTWLIAKKIHELIGTIPVLHDGKALEITVSIGISQTLPEDSRRDDVMLRADRALYEAKETGRNKIIEH